MMNSSRCQYVNLDSQRRSSWLPAVVVAVAVSLGVVAGLAVSSPSADASSLYSSTAVRTVPAVQAATAYPTVRSLEAMPYSLGPEEPGMDMSADNEVQYDSATTSSWASFAVLPIAAMAGFLIGSRKSAPTPVEEAFEVVIDDGEEEIAMAATTGPKTDLYAVVAIGGHQYVVQPGQILSIDKLPLEIGDEFAFDKVLMLKNGEKVEFGHPYLSNARVTAEVVRNSKGRKIRIFKYRAKKHTRLTRGHRQKYTDIHITEVAGQKVPSKVNFEALDDTLVNA